MLKFFYKMLERPKVYNITQVLLGADRVFRAIKKVVKLQLSENDYSNVLDVGCGTGMFADFFKVDYTGIDINPDYIKSVGNKSRGTFLVGDATSLPFSNIKFDLVFTLGVLHHLNKNERQKMFDEMWRVCKHKGHILIVDGLVPSNKLNLIGYVLAKLDRGRYKMRMDKFKEMVSSAYPDRIRITYTQIKCFPYELVAVILQKC